MRLSVLVPFVVLALALAAPRAAAQCGTEESLFQNPGNTGPSYGWSVAIEGDMAVVGSTEYLGDHFGSGSVVVWKRDPVGWSAVQTWRPENYCSDEFGDSVDTDGTWIVAGAPRAFCGSFVGAQSYFLHRQHGTWQEAQRVTGPFGYGAGVAIDGAWAAISAVNHGVDMYRLHGTTWVLVQTLDDPDVMEHVQHVALDGGVLVVGMPWAISGRGAATVYRLDVNTWRRETRLVAPDGVGNDNFGMDVTVDDDVIVVGSPHDDDQGSSSGSAYVFRESPQGWRLEQKLLAPMDAAGLQFGHSASVRGDVLVVGSPEASASLVGSAYLFRFDGTVWQFEQHLRSKEGALLNQFGYDVATDGENAVIGAPSGGQFGYGIAYAHTLRRLALVVKPKQPRALDDVIFSVCKGEPDGQVFLYVTEVNGQPTNLLLADGAFGADGSWSHRIEVPPGLPHTVARFEAVGVVQGGAVETSNAQAVVLP